VIGHMHRRSLPRRVHLLVLQRHYQQESILVDSLISKVEHQAGHHFRPMYRTLQAVRVVTTAVPKVLFHHRQLAHDLQLVPEDPGMPATHYVLSITY
jgi:hypothetical protein